MRIIDRFDKYMSFRHLNDNRVTLQLGLSNGTIGKSRSQGRDLSAKVVDLILSTYKDLSRDWLISGEGDMLTTGEPEVDEMITIPKGAFNKLTETLHSQQREISRLIGMLDQTKQNVG